VVAVALGGCGGEGVTGADAGAVDASSHDGSSGGDGASPDGGSGPAGGPDKIRYVIVIVKENHTFDSYFTNFPGAESSTMAKKDGSSTPFKRPIAPDGPLGCDVNHDHDHALAAYNNGEMNGFTAGTFCSDPNTPFYMYQEAQIPNYWALARNFVLADHFFSTILTSTTPGHFAGVAAQSPFYGNADSASGCSVPEVNRAGVDAYNRDTCNLRGQVDPCFDVPSIVDAFPKDLDWRAYGNIGAGGRIATPFNFILSVGGNNATRAAHYKALPTLLADLDKGDQPNLAYVDVAGPESLSEHPPAAVCPGENYSIDIVNRIMKGPHWKETAILITWDDWGGFYDHVAPALEKCDFTPGFRLPLLIVSPYAKKGHVLKTVTEHASIPRFIEDVFGMPRMHERDAHARDDTAGSLLDAFDFDQAPRDPMPLPLRNCP
jgi:phospholipase C